MAASTRSHVVDGSSARRTYFEIASTQSSGSQLSKHEKKVLPSLLQITKDQRYFRAT